MSNAHRLPYSTLTHHPPAIAFHCLFSLFFVLPIVMVIGAIAHLPIIIVIIAGLVAFYDTAHRLWYLRLAHQAIQQDQANQPRSGQSAPSLAVIIPAWNEQEVLPRTINMVLAQADQPEQIIVSDDGSTDETIAQLTVLYDVEFQGRMGRSRLHSNLHILRKPHSGKADSLNQAIACAPVDVILVLDADTQLLAGALSSLRQAFAQDPSLHVVGGVFLPRCSARWTGRFFEFVQRYEYARTHLWRLAWSHLDSSLAVPGACSAFRRETLMAIRGFNPKSWVEDYEVIYRMQKYLRSRRQRCHVRVEPGLRVYTQAPENLMPFLRQRRRWAGGFIETVWRYRDMVGNRRYGPIGRLYLGHNTLMMLQPWYLIAGILTAVLLIKQGIILPTFLEGAVLAKGTLDLGTSFWGLHLYRNYFQRRDVSWVGLLGFELLAIPLVFMPLAQMSHVWGWITCGYRQANW